MYTMAFVSDMEAPPGWTVSLSGGAQIGLPPDWVFRIYCDLEPPGKFQLKQLVEKIGSGPKARQFVYVATKHRWVVRTGWGEYVALDPSVVVRLSGLEGYWKDLLAVHEAMRMVDVPHAFLCLTAMAQSDLVPARSHVVVPPSHQGQQVAEAFVYAYGPTRAVSLDLGGWRVRVDTVSPEDAALLLAATTLPREVQAARTILGSKRPSKKLASKLNAYGLDVRDDVTRSEQVDLRLPRFIERRRKDLAEELLRTGGT